MSYVSAVMRTALALALITALGSDAVAQPEPVDPAPVDPAPAEPAPPEPEPTFEPPPAAGPTLDPDIGIPTTDDDFGPLLVIERVELAGNRSTAARVIRRALPIV